MLCNRFSYNKIFFKAIVFSCLIVCAFFSIQKVHAQTDYIPYGDKQYQLLDRLKIKLKDYPELNFTTVKMVSRADFTSVLEHIVALDKSGEISNLLTDVDREDIRSALMNNADYTRQYQDSFQLQKPILGILFQTPAHLYQKIGEDFSFVADAVGNLQLGNSSDDQKLFQNTRALRFRGKIEDRVGFYALISENQERDPLYVQKVVNPYPGLGILGLPGQAFYKNYSNHPGAFDYFGIRGGITFNAGEKLDFALAYDQFKIGDGFRSLFISDYGAPFYFLRANYHINHQLDWTSVVAQTIAPFTNAAIFGYDSTRPRNYMMFHHLDWQATSLLRVGLFENTIFNGSAGDGKPLGIYNTDPTKGPVSTPEKGNTSRSRVGIDFRAVPVRNVELYGQWLIDGLTNWGTSFKNRNAWQVGGKYIDAFGIENLNLQAETNIVRPYAYSSNYVENNYQHYNMPLAHPLGSNFREFVGLLSYRPLKRLYVNLKGIVYKKGLDENGLNYGGDLLRPYTYNKPDEAFKIGSGNGNKVQLYSATASYELIQNLYIDGNYTYRKSETDLSGASNTKFFTFGLRWNMPHKDYDF
ncbi:MAG: hypothetical protein QM610_15380 [Chitinophagaceae bacterium]